MHRPVPSRTAPGRSGEEKLRTRRCGAVAGCKSAGRDGGGAKFLSRRIASNFSITFNSQNKSNIQTLRKARIYLILVETETQKGKSILGTIDLTIPFDAKCSLLCGNLRM
jgi:hypothetical protein